MKLVNKIVKKVFLLLLVSCTLLTTLSVNAESIPSTIKMASKSSMYYFSESKGTDYISGYNFYMKKLNNGMVAYCASSIRSSAPGGLTLKLKGKADKGLSYIISNGYPAKSFTKDAKKDYYITQSAIWYYFDLTRGQTNWKNTNFASAKEGTMKYYVNKLANEAKNVLNSTSNVEKPTITLSVSNKSLSLNGSYYVSSLITADVANADDTYTVSLDKAPKGTVLKSENGEVKTTFANGEKFRVYVPGDAVFITVTIEATVSKTTGDAYVYTYGGSYQDIVTIVEYPTSESASATIEFNTVKTKLSISKQDITTKKELPGATLVLKDANGKEIEKWVSGNEPHYLEGLLAGKYTLEETIAPKGYILSTEKIEFELKNDGNVETVIMYNEQIPETTKVKISKQDITTKKELPGATLVLKDANGKEIEKWVSDNEPHYIEGLEEGKYILEETIAPEGYELSTEKIEFELKNDGTIKSVVMYNTPLKDVPNTALNASSGIIIVGTILIILGMGMVIKYVKGRE